MKQIYIGRSGQLENTTFAILSPNGKKKLTRTGRGPFHEYRNASQMAAGMNEIAKTYKVSDEQSFSNASLPIAASVDIGLNISSADIIPMVVVVASDESKANELEQKLLSLAWSESIIGQFTYAKASDAKELSALSGIKGDIESLASILLVEPGQFGLSGKVLAQLDADTGEDELKSAMLNTIMNCDRIAKDHNSHVQLGIQLGVDWESKIPETDAQSVAARKRARGK